LDVCPRLADSGDGERCLKRVSHGKIKKVFVELK
jgi:hypothetical protein